MTDVYKTEKIFSPPTKYIYGSLACSLSLQNVVTKWQCLITVGFE